LVSSGCWMCLCTSYWCRVLHCDVMFQYMRDDDVRLYWWHEEGIWSWLWFTYHWWQPITAEILLQAGTSPADWTARSCHTASYRLCYLLHEICLSVRWHGSVELSLIVFLAAVKLLVTASWWWLHKLHWFAYQTAVAVISGTVKVVISRIVKTARFFNCEEKDRLTGFTYLVTVWNCS